MQDARQQQMKKVYFCRCISIVGVSAPRNCYTNCLLRQDGSTWAVLLLFETVRFFSKFPEKLRKNREKRAEFREEFCN